MAYKIILALLLLPVAAVAQKQRQTTYMIGVGPTELYDTYLSQEHFNGTGVTFLATSQSLKPEARWTTLVEHQAHFATASDRSDDSNELSADYTFFIGRLRSFAVLPSLTVEAGAMAVGNLGFIYNTSNGNNPAQARASIHIMPTATATWRFCVGKTAAALRYETQLPLLGLMFSPNYGQSYYEIFSRGNYDHNVVPVTLVSAPSMRHQFMADVALSAKATLRIGYLADLQQAKVNNLKSHIYSNHFMIGIVKRFSVTHHRP